MTSDERITELTAYVDHLRETIDGIGRHTPYPAQCWTLEEFRAAVRVPRQEEPNEALRDLLETAWGIIANAGHGDWTRESAEWQDAAARFRERWHAVLAVRAAGAPGGQP